MDDESSDILGGALPIVRGTESGHWSNLPFSVKTASILGLLLMACVAFSHAWDHFLKWQEVTYKLSMRRRHGIPDSDRRPFNVAYAAVTRARQDREAKERAVEEIPKPDQQVPALADAQSIRQRFSDTGPQRNMAGAWSSTATAHYMGANSGAGPAAARNYPTPSPTDPLNFADRYNPKPPSISIFNPQPQPGPSKHDDPSRWSSRGLNPTAGAEHDDRRKRVLDDEDDLEPVKKSRVEIQELIDGEEDAGWEQLADGQNASGADGRAKRGSKRVLGEEDDEATGSKRTRDKRARKVLRDRTPEDQIMVDEGIDGDEPTELVSIFRGRKRDRAEAGSTFGGDDGELALEEGGEDDGKNSRRRKRRTVMKRKSDVHTRGQKRDRDAQSHDSDSEEDENRVKKRTSRKRRGNNDAKEEAGSDVSMGDSQISQDPLCKGRRIGEEWEANGVQWKVGLNGDRLRQALVKKARSKFVMPKDSQHPDREANLEVFIESWLTEDQYKEAQDRHELAWQDSPKASAEPETPGNVPDSPSKPGKNLLWVSTAPKDSSTPKRGPFRQSIATNLGIHINPFQQAQYGPGRRVVSSYAGPASAAGDSINTTGSPKHRAFSKWEKQDLEAQAMAKMRAKAQEEKAKRAAATPEVKKVGATGGAGTTAPPSNPTVPASSMSFPTPAEKPTQTTTFGVPPATTNGITATEAAKPTTTLRSEQPLFKMPTEMAGAPKPSFALPVAQNVTSKPAVPPSVSTAPQVPPVPAPSPFFSFASQPAQPQQPTPPAASSLLNVPSGAATRPSSPASASASSQPTPTPVQQQQKAVPKPPLFTFAAPSSGGPPSQFSLGAKAPISVFGTRNEPPKKPEQRAGDGGSLISRLGGINGSQSSQTATSASTSSGGGNSLSFVQPTVPAVGSDPIKYPSTFSVSTTPQSTPVTTTAPATSGTGALKFNFGVKHPNASPNPTLVASSAPASSGEALDTLKPTSAPFIFGAQSISKPKAMEVTDTFTPKLSTPPSSIFGSTNSLEGGKNATPALSASSHDASAKAAFSGFGGGGGFSAASALPSFSSFGAGGNVFGGSGTTPAQPTQSSPFLPSNTGSTSTMFGNPSAFASSNSGGTEASKLTFSFNANPAEPSKPPTIFGQPSNSTPTEPQTSSTGAQPPANNSTPAPTPSAFGFPSTSGTPPTFGQQQQ